MTDEITAFHNMILAMVGKKKGGGFSDGSLVDFSSKSTKKRREKCPNFSLFFLSFCRTKTHLAPISHM